MNDAWIARPGLILFTENCGRCVRNWGVTGHFFDPDGNRCELEDHGDGFFAPAA